MITDALLPGDVIATRSNSFYGAAIRLGAALLGKPNTINHIAIVDHTDQNGTTWVIEGRPGGVGWRDASEYLRSPWTISNALQPKSTIQREQVVKVIRAAIGTPYNWDAIARDAADAIHLNDLFASSERWNGHMPGHVVCSSLAEYGYASYGLARPSAARGMSEVTPGDWEQFILTEGWRNYR